MNLCVFSCVCVCLHASALENRLNLIYSPWGHLLTESNLLAEPRPNGSLTRLLLYIAAVMGTSLEILVLLICAPLPRFEQKCLTFSAQPLPAGKLLMHYGCGGSINPPPPTTPTSLHLPPARTVIPLGGLRRRCPCLLVHPQDDGVPLVASLLCILGWNFPPEKNFLDEFLSPLAAVQTLRVQVTQPIPSLSPTGGGNSECLWWKKDFEPRNKIESMRDVKGSGGSSSHIFARGSEWSSCN